MVCFLLCPNQSLATLLAAANDVIGNIKYIDFDLLHVRSSKAGLPLHFEHSIQDRLRMNFSVVFLHDGSVNPFEVLPLPVNLKAAGDRIHKPFVTLKNLGWSRN